MIKALKLLCAVFLCAGCVSAQSDVAESSAKPLVLQKGEGELRSRRPRDVPSPSRDFLVKVSPKTNGSKHLYLGTEEIPPGALIPKHRHHGEEEILLIQTGKAHVWLGDKEYDARAGAVVFIPSETWISLQNTGNENISMVFVFNEPSYEEMMRCASVPKGLPAPPISREDFLACYRHGDAEIDIVHPSAASKKHARTD